MLTEQPQPDPAVIDARWSKIKSKILDAATDLMRRGSMASLVTPSGRRIWTVRYDDRTEVGRRRQRAIYVGDDPGLVERACKLLHQLQAVGLEIRHANRLATLRGHPET